MRTLAAIVEQLKRVLREVTVKSRSFTVILHKEENMYIAEYPEVGTVDQGEPIEQAIAGLTEATRLYLQSFPLPETVPSQCHC